MMKKLNRTNRLLAAAAMAALGVFPACGSDSHEPSAAVAADLIARWNAVQSAEAPFQFEWLAFSQFPHPTFSGGSTAAYQAFADHLTRFYGRGDNFEFLSKNQ